MGAADAFYYRGSTFPFFFFFFAEMTGSLKKQNRRNANLCSENVISWYLGHGIIGRDAISFFSLKSVFGVGYEAPQKVRSLRKIGVNLYRRTALLQGAKWDGPTATGPLQSKSAKHGNRVPGG